MARHHPDHQQAVPRHEVGSAPPQAMAEEGAGRIDALAEARLQEGIEWVRRSRQADDAVVSHLGVSTRLNLRYGLAIAPQPPCGGSRGVVVVFCIAEPQYKRAHLQNGFVEGERDSLEAAVSRHARVLDRWNGEPGNDSCSFNIDVVPSAGIRRASENYRRLQTPTTVRLPGSWRIPAPLDQERRRAQQRSEVERTRRARVLDELVAELGGGRVEPDGRLLLGYEEAAALAGRLQLGPRIGGER
jgi:hypothetical protein